MTVIGSNDSYCFKKTGTALKYPPSSLCPSPYTLKNLNAVPLNVLFSYSSFKSNSVICLAFAYGLIGSTGPDSEYGISLKGP